MLDYILRLLGFNVDRMREVLNVRFIILILFILAVILIVIDLTKMYYKCPKSEIEYRYVPRSFKEEQEEPVSMRDLFGKMFDKSSPWVNSFTESKDIKNIRDSDFVSQ